MRRLIPSVLIAIAFLLLAGLPALRADDFAERGREVLKNNQHAVVTVLTVLKVSAQSGRTSEVNEETTGTVVDPSGLTVIALSGADPAELNRKLSDDYKVDTEVTSVRILQEDGTEVPSELVLRDRDLDLAFIRPKAKMTSPMAAVDLSKSGTAQVLDQVIAINRLNRAAARAFSASAERISAVVQKPRLFYIPDSTMSATGLGSPVFTVNGNILGIVVMRAVNTRGSGSSRDGITSIILPAEDILKGAKQAPEAKGDDNKKEPAKDSKDADK